MIKKESPSSKEKEALGTDIGQVMINGTDTVEVSNCQQKTLSEDIQNLDQVYKIIPKLTEEGFSRGINIKKGESEIVTAIRSFPDDVIAHFHAITKQITEAVGTECEKYIAQLEILAPAILAPRVPILILGETGSGKNRLTNIIHDVSKGKDFPFIHVNCESFTDELLLSELFGHEKGAFSGADKLKKGLVELANKGTLFLDEVDKAGGKTRNVLLKFLDDGTFYRVGGEEELSSDTRIICGSNQDLPWMVENDLFEREFYERIAGFKPKIPPLRERKEDLESLVLSKCNEISDDQSKILSKTLNKNVQIKFTIEPEALGILRMYPFPGNVRELHNIIDNVYLKCVKHKTLIASKSIVLECLPTPKLKIKQKSLHYVEKELKDIFLNWYQSFYFAKGKEIIEKGSKRTIKDGFLQKVVNPILANIYESQKPADLGMKNKTQKNKMARSIIGIGGYDSGKDKSTLSKCLEDYNSLLKEQE